MRGMASSEAPASLNDCRYCERLQLFKKAGSEGISEKGTKVLVFLRRAAGTWRVLLEGWGSCAVAWASAARKEGVMVAVAEVEATPKPGGGGVGVGERVGGCCSWLESNSLSEGRMGELLSLMVCSRCESAGATPTVGLWLVAMGLDTLLTADGVSEREKVK